MAKYFFQQQDKPFFSLPKEWFKYDSSMTKETLGHDEGVIGQ